MNLTEMRAVVRRELRDEDSEHYRWTDDELDRHIVRAVHEFSEYLPLESKQNVATTSGSRDISLASLSGRVHIEAVEYPVDRFPRRYQPFSLWGDTITLLGDEVPDGSDACIYYGQLHTIDGAGSTIPKRYEDLVVAGACGHAAVAWAMSAINRVNVGGTGTPEHFLAWGNEKLRYFWQELRRLGRKNRVRASTLYIPYYPSSSRTTDYGP